MHDIYLTGDIARDVARHLCEEVGMAMVRGNVSVADAVERAMSVYDELTKALSAVYRQQLWFKLPARAWVYKCPVCGEWTSTISLPTSECAHPQESDDWPGPQEPESVSLFMEAEELLKRVHETESGELVIEREGWRIRHCRTTDTITVFRIPGWRTGLLPFCPKIEQGTIWRNGASDNLDVFRKGLEIIKKALGEEGKCR